MRRESKTLPAPSQNSSGPSCGCVLMAIGLCISAAFIIFIVTVVSMSPETESELPEAVGRTDLEHESQRLDETKALIQRIAKELAYPDSQKGLEIVKAPGFRAADVRSQLEGKSSYLSGIVVSVNTTNLNRVALGSLDRRLLEVPSFDTEQSMISYCLDLCRAAEGESSVAESRAYVRKLSDEVGFAIWGSRGFDPLGWTRTTRMYPGSGFPTDQIANALRQLETCHSILSRQLKESQTNATPEDGSSTPSWAQLLDEDIQRIRYCRAALRFAYPKEFEAADPPGAKMREAEFLRRPFPLPMKSFEP